MKQTETDKMDYKSSKIYKLQCEDGHFYIGSSVTDLRKRLYEHKSQSKRTPEQRVYKHINGEWNRVRIILVEEVVCENKQQLLQIEDKHIRAEQENPLCLNVRVVIAKDGEHQQKKVEWNEKHPDYFKDRYEQNKVLHPKPRLSSEEANERKKARCRAYYQTHKEEAKERCRKSRMKPEKAD